MNGPDTPPPAGKPPSATTYRGRHRHLSDEAAHDNAKPFEPTPIIEHPRVCADPPTLVTTPDELADCIAHLRSAGTFGYDSEFIGEDSYYPHLCVIQAATTDRVMLIDPLAIDDLSSWWALLNDASLTKIVHAGAQDIEPVYRLTGNPAANVFDTQVCAGLAGLDYPLSLGNMIQAILHVQHDAGAKFSRWERRPLSPQQIHYAAGDVRYLCAIHAWLSDKLSALGNSAFANDACAELCDPQLYAFDPLARKVKAKGINKLSRKKRAVFNGVLIWREHLARELNVTPRGLLADQAVYEIADALPREIKPLANIKFVPRPVAEQHGRSLLDAITAALDGPYPLKPEPPTCDRDEHRTFVNALWDRIAQRCAEQSITPSVVTSKRELGPLIAAVLEGRPVPTLPTNSGWRKALLGPVIEDAALIIDPA